jgi:hypothetical protein
MPTESGIHPPKVRLAIRVGVTGHRPNHLEGADIHVLLQRIHKALEMVRDVGRAASADPGAGYSAGQPVFRVISPLAEGSDRLVAEAALHLGYEVHAPFPFPKEDYERDFSTPESRKTFKELLTKATSVLELDGSRENAQAEDHAYEYVGRTVLRNSDVLIAIWDGGPPTGRGGTAQIVREASQSHIPVIWIKSKPPHDACLLVSSETGEPLQVSLDELKKHLHAFLWLDTPKQREKSDRRIRDLRRHYFREKRYRWTLGVLFNLVTKMVAGSRPWPLRFFSKDYEKETREEWAHAWEVARELPSDSTKQVEERFLLHYAWADKLATHYANIYRSSFTANYLLAALAVLFALRAYFDSIHLRFWIGMELAAITSIIALTTVGRFRHWHERWIDYRLLAEKFRHMRFLFLICRVSVTERVPAYETHGEERKTWVDWHFQAVVREAGILHGKMDRPYRAAYRKLLSSYELPSQMDYHDRNCKKSTRIAHRLQAFSTGLFYGTLVICLIHLFFEEGSWTDFLVQMAAVLPAFGAAIRGIESQGDFHHVARRSRSVGQVLAGIVSRMDRAEKDLPSEVLGDIAEKAADAMGAELADWRTGFQDKPLEYPV